MNSSAPDELVSFKKHIQNIPYFPVYPAGFTGCIELDTAMTPDKLLSDIVDSTASAKTHFDLWWAQASEAPLEKRDHVTHDHKDFFSASRKAHYTAFFIYFARIYDKRSDSSSLQTYLKLLYPDKLQRNAEVRWNDFLLLSNRAAPLITVRHKAIAHVDVGFTEKDIFEPLNITWHQVRAILADTVAFVVALHGAHHQGEIGIPREGRMREATFQVFKSLEKPRGT